MEEVKTTERGWAGHFICSHMCNFRRNTLVEYGDKKIVVSTVGNYSPQETGIKSYDMGERSRQIGHERYYETMVFEAKYEDPYWDADVSKEVEFQSKWAVSTLDFQSDKEANQMHEDVVEEIKQIIQKKDTETSVICPHCGERQSHQSTHYCEGLQGNNWID